MPVHRNSRENYLLPNQITLKMKETEDEVEGTHAKFQKIVIVPFRV